MTSECRPSTVIVTETIYTNTNNHLSASMAPPPTVSGINAAAPSLPSPSLAASSSDPNPNPNLIGTATLAVSTAVLDPNSATSIASAPSPDTTIHAFLTSTSLQFTTNTLLTTSSSSPHTSSSTSSLSASHPSTGTITGATLGALAGLGLLAALLAWCCKKHSHSRSRFHLKFNRRKNSNASTLTEQAKDLSLREDVLAAAAGAVGAVAAAGAGRGSGGEGKRGRPEELRRSERVASLGIGRALGSPTGTGESGNGTRRSAGGGMGDARGQVGRWL